MSDKFNILSAKVKPHLLAIYVKVRLFLNANYNICYG